MPLEGANASLETVQDTIDRVSGAMASRPPWVLPCLGQYS
jgi:hypothetical protein